jgi:hypothetical protein
MNTLLDPAETFHLPPVGLELMHEAPPSAVYLGDLACLGGPETNHYDDIITVNKPADPHLGLDLEFGFDDSPSLL